MTIGNLLYLAVLTGRTPIIPAFAPSHVGATAPLVPFSEIFDIERLAVALRTPVVEWHEVKDIESEDVETLGCWSVWATVQPEQGARKSMLTPVQKLGAYARFTVVSADRRLTHRRHLVHARPGLGSARERLAHDILAAREARIP
jgi:hypothetical protein